jgi:hypothetical protein
MQGLPTRTPATEDDEASIPTENVRDDPSPNLHTNGEVKLRRKAAKRTLPWDLPADELEVVSPPPPLQSEDIRARNKPRLEEPFSASTDEATRKTISSDVSVDLPPDDAVAYHADEDPVTDTQPNASATRVRRR